jgi:hypothetical protein
MKKTKEDEDEEASEDDEDEEGVERDDEEQGAEEYVFNIKTHASNGDNKEYNYVHGMCDFPSSVCIAYHLESFNVNCILQD